MGRISGGMEIATGFIEAGNHYGMTVVYQRSSHVHLILT
jgi:hypothetical protein